MNRAIKILMERDELTKEEAIDLINEAVEACILKQSDELWTDITGLDLDYLEDALYYSLK